MPTCSQAKIITNIESDLNRRVYEPTVPSLRPRGRSIQALYICNSTDTGTKLPSIYKDLLQQSNKSAVPINFLYNSSVRNRTSLSPVKRRSSFDLCETSSSSTASICSEVPQRRLSNSDEYQEVIVDVVSKTRRNSIINTYTNLPKLALEIENNTNNAKRLLALASIRPSKTFHKEITSEESEILKKYYDIIKPRLSTTTILNTNNDQAEMDAKNTIKQADQIPILYDSAKINLDNYKILEEFLHENKDSLTSGDYTIVYNPPGFNGFVLRDKSNEKYIKFPSNTHDIFVALMLTKNANNNVRLNEAHILKSLSWNDKDTILSCTNKSSIKSKINDSKTKVNDISLESVRSLSSLVASIASPHLVKNVFDNSIDLSSLPGGINFEMPAYDDIDLDMDIKYTNNGQSHRVSTKGKLKNATIKKIKEKLSTTRVMWFAKAPERKTLSIIFESSIDMSHEDVVNSVNVCLSNANFTSDRVTQVEFVPRSVHMNSVYVDNLWIVTLSNKDAKYYLISHDFCINGQKIQAKSYDEYINMEYEKFIRSEKYRQLLKSHEKALKQQQKQKKNSF